MLLGLRLGFYFVNFRLLLYKVNQVEITTSVIDGLKEYFNGQMCGFLLTWVQVKWVVVYENDLMLNLVYH